MPSLRVSKENNTQMHFITCTIEKWYYLFDRHHRFQILADCLEFFQKNKDLKVYSYVFMLNHIHLIIKSPDVAGFIRDFKKFTTKKILENITATEPDVLKIFPDMRIWRKTNYPEIIQSEKFFLQKKIYIENNPVSKEYVMDSAYWKYSSANPQSPIDIQKIEVYNC